MEAVERDGILKSATDKLLESFLGVARRSAPKTANHDGRKLRRRMNGRKLSNHQMTA